LTFRPPTEVLWGIQAGRDEGSALKVERYWDWKLLRKADWASDLVENRVPFLRAAS
jgi:hypothetical protein